MKTRYRSVSKLYSAIISVLNSGYRCVNKLYSGYRCVYKLYSGYRCVNNSIGIESNVEDRYRMKI